MWVLHLSLVALLFTLGLSATRAATVCGLFLPTNPPNPCVHVNIGFVLPRGQFVFCFPTVTILTETANVRPFGLVWPGHNNHQNKCSTGSSSWGACFLPSRSCGCFFSRISFCIFGLMGTTKRKQQKHRDEQPKTNRTLSPFRGWVWVCSLMVHISEQRGFITARDASFFLLLLLLMKHHGQRKPFYTGTLCAFEWRRLRFCTR